MASQQRNAPTGAPEHVAQTLRASVGEPLTRPEILLDAALVVAGIAEVISPPLALAGLALNRLAHHSK